MKAPIDWAFARRACIALVSLTTACAMSDNREPPVLSLSVPGAEQFDLPDVLGKPVLVVALELPEGTLQEGETALFEIEFAVDYRGRVTTSQMKSSSHPALDSRILAQHPDWMYAIATRADLCAMTRYRALQRIGIARRDGKLVAPIEPAQVLEVHGRDKRPLVDDLKELSIPNYRNVVYRIPYPRAALIDGVEARLALIVEFGADGTVSDSYPVNAAYDRWGFTQGAMQAVRKLKADPAPGRTVLACIPLHFRLR